MSILKILGWIFLVSLAILIQSNHFLEFCNVNPNLILILFFLPQNQILVLITFILTLILLSYWFKEILILGILVIIGLFLRKFLTGREVWDFLILIFLGTLGFYLIDNFHFILAETVYNIIIGGLLFLISQFFNEKEKAGIKS